MSGEKDEYLLPWTEWTVTNIYDALEFSAGASYVVMCYNLHGNGTEPGPKADPESINLYDGEMKGEVEWV